MIDQIIVGIVVISGLLLAVAAMFPPALAIVTVVINYLRKLFVRPPVISHKKSEKEI